MERVNKEIKRRSRVVGAFPSDESLIRLIGTILMDINEEWVTGKRYLTIYPYEPFHRPPACENFNLEFFFELHLNIGTTIVHRDTRLEI